MGGYTPCEWSSKKGYLEDPINETFIFSLTNGDKFIMKDQKKAIYNNEVSGPIFGGSN